MCPAFQINPLGVTLEEIKAMDARGEIPRKLDREIKKDTVAVPDGGYTLLRFHATNPGFCYRILLIYQNTLVSN